MKDAMGLRPHNLGNAAVPDDLSRVVCALLDRWGLSLQQRYVLLGGDPESAAMPYSAEVALLSTRLPDVVNRAGQLLAIHRALRVLFLENADLRFSWVQRRNQALDGKTPIDLMLDEGSAGIAKVLTLLDRHCSM